ncbi:MAG: efflux RND transporter periplasmic adaptor subunit [Alphaproteobacteria bacterium]|nr:efflux RND transporter periplasmic adaptor subunit [Alphaproteobacteria bacterium]
MSRRMIIMLIAAGIVLGGVFTYKAVGNYFMQSYFASRSEPPQTVAATKVGYQPWQDHLDAVGNVRASSGADLAFEVSGTVAAINFKSGDDVKAGTTLLSLNASDDIAKLHSLEAAADLANVTYQRSLKLFARKFVSQATLDTDRANLKSARAQVAQQRAVIEKKTLRAPFDGRLGIRAVDLGQYLNAGTPFVTLQALDPMFVDFFLPQQALDEIKVGQAVRAHVDTYPGQTFAGTIEAINSKVDADSRNVQVRASFPNPERKLLPGMYATVTIDVGKPKQLLTLPQTAISFNPYGDTVFVVENKGNDAQGKPQLIAKQTFVVTGAKRGDQVAILKGIKEGATIVTFGQVKLRNDTPVTIGDTVQVGSASSSPAQAQ